MSFTDDCRMALGPDMPPGNEVVRLMRWLDDDLGGGFQFRSTGSSFLSTTPVAGIDAVWSHLAFVIDTGMIRDWLGRTDMANTLVSIVRCGGDGSDIGLWHSNDGMRYVFWGSQGEAFVLADSAMDFIRIITMGYEAIETHSQLEELPGALWEDDREVPRPDTAIAKDWVRRTFDTDYRDTAVELIPRVAGPDPFEVWVVQNNAC